VSVAGRHHIENYSPQLSRPELDDRARVLLASTRQGVGRFGNDFDEAFYWFSEPQGARRRNLAYDVCRGTKKKLQRITETSKKLTHAAQVATRLWSDIS